MIPTDTTSSYASAATAPRPWRMSRDQYHELGDLGFFRSKRVQLIDGLVIETGPMGPPHATSVSLCMNLVNCIVGTGRHVRCRLPLAINEWSEPEPDIALVVGTVEQYAGQHPSTAELIIEVADSSLALDLDVKSVLYAKAGVKEYWLVDLNARCAELFRKPDQVMGLYRRREMAKEGEKFLVNGVVEIAVGEVLP